MKTSILNAFLITASGILLSSCAMTHGYFPMDYEGQGNSTVERQADYSESDARNDQNAVATTHSPSNPGSTSTTEPVNFDRPGEQVTESQPPVQRLTSPETIPDRIGEYDAARNPGIAPGEKSLNAIEIRDKQSAEPAPLAPLRPSNSGGVPKWFLVVCCILLPPLAVALVFGITDKFWIDLLLTLCFWLPGVIYAFIQVF